MAALTCFKAYDIRGKLGTELNEDIFATQNPEIDRTDCISLAFDNWRLNLRSSNTEPLLRLNVESCGDAGLVASRVSEIERVLGVGS